jgi:Flp pilus assembly pilin Flp
MKTMIRKLWKNEDGFVISIELILVATILVIGLAAGLGQLRDSVVAELADLGNAIGALDQSYGIGAVQNQAGTSDGSNGTTWTDGVDSSFGDNTYPNLTASGLTVSVKGEYATDASGSGS